MKTFGLRMKHTLKDVDISLTNILLKQPVVILDLNKLPKNKNHSLTYSVKLNIQEKYSYKLHISRMVPKVTTELNVEKHWILKKHLPKEASVLTVEICTINLALKLVSISNKEKFIIHSESIYNLLKTKLDNFFVAKLLNKLNSMNHSKKVIFCWIPIHIRYQGNDKLIDWLAKAALNMVPGKNLKYLVLTSNRKSANNYKEMATIMGEKSL